MCSYKISFIEIKCLQYPLRLFFQLKVLALLVLLLVINFGLAFSERNFDIQFIYKILIM